MAEKILCIQYLLEQFQRQHTRVFEDQLSLRANSGVEYAAAVIYADYLGFQVIGRIPPWVRRLRRYPKAVPSQLREGVTRILAIQHVHLNDEGELVSSVSEPALL